MLDDDAWLSTDDVAVLLALRVRTVYRLTKRGEIRWTRAGHAFRFRRADLDAYIVAPVSAQARWPTSIRRAGNRRERRTPPKSGCGLGLSIVAGSAAVNGGAAWYEPNVPRGACFAVRLPASKGSRVSSPV